MSELTTQNRRNFIIGSLAFAGGLVVACKTPSKSQSKDLGGDLQNLEAVLRPNAWVQVTADGQIICILDKVEMGQGMMTTYAMLVAEELNIDPATVVVKFAPPDIAYLNPQYGVQITASSTSTSVSWQPLRLAAASTRTMLIAGAAQKLEVDASDCICDGGRITHTPTNQSLGFADIAAYTAANIQPPLNPKPKSASNFRVLGKAVNRVDDVAKVTGAATYGIDVQVDGMLYAAVKHTDAHNATIQSFDATAAQTFLTPLDPNAQILQISTGVAVVTTSSWIALTAAAKIKITATGGSVAPDFNGTLSTAATTAGVLVDSAPSATVVEQGNFDTAYAASANKLTAVYECPYLPHVTLEPQNCTASYNGSTLEIWAPTQMPGAAQAVGKSVTGLNLDQVTVHTTFIGGGFGRRLTQDFVQDASEITFKLKKPVKVVWSREEDTMHDHYRPAFVHNMQASIDNGQISSWYHRLTSPSVTLGIAHDFLLGLPPGPFIPGPALAFLTSTFKESLSSHLIPDPFATEGADKNPYQLPNLRVKYTYFDPGVPVGYWRSVGHSPNAFAVESFIDELAAAAGADPYTFRQSMLAQSPRDLAVLNQVAVMANWSTPVTQPATGGGVRARGIALHSCFGSYCAQVVQVVVNGTQLSIEKIWCAVDCGYVLNPSIVRQQVEGGIVFGLSAATRQAITFKAGATVQAAMFTVGLMKNSETPDIQVAIVGGQDPSVPPTGIGEVAVPAVAPALACAAAKATGQRYRTLPLGLTVKTGRLAAV